MTGIREKFLEGLKYRVKEKSQVEQEAEKELAKFVRCANELADELESKNISVNQINLYEMFEKKHYSGKYDIFKLDRDEGMIRLAIEVSIRERTKRKIDIGR